MKVNDVFRFQYHVVEGERDRYWCFDGKLIARPDGDGIRLVDTYWTSGDGRSFTPEEAEKRGVLTFVCNLDEVEAVEEYEVPNYAPENIFNLSYQHGCYKRFVKRKGAAHSRDAMLKHLGEQMEKAKRDLNSAAWSIERIARDIERVRTATDLERMWA